MSTTDLLTPFLKGGIRNVNFFNGRVLTAEDLKDEQRANREQHHKLGVGIGEGVIEGLNVQLKAGDPTSSVIEVTAGTALNRSGNVLCLPETVDVAIVPQPDQSPGGLW